MTCQLMEITGVYGQNEMDSSSEEQATYDVYYFGNERMNLKVQKSLRYTHVFVQ